MKANTKRFALPGFLLALLFATTACGGSISKPLGGLDVSALSPRLLSISPIIAGPDVEQTVSEADRPATGSQPQQAPSTPQSGISPEASGSTISNQQSTISNQQ